MKIWTVTIQIEGLVGRRVSIHTIKARTEKSARAKAYNLIGNQSGEIISMRCSDEHL